MTLESASRTSSWSTIRLSLAAYLSRFPRIVSFDEQLGVLRVTGDEDRTTSGRRRRPLSAALSATRDVIVDLADLNFADPSLMIDLACLAQRLRAHGPHAAPAPPAAAHPAADRARRAAPAALGAGDRAAA